MDQRARFGPNADDVVALLEQLDRLAMAEVVSLAAAGRAMTGDAGPDGSGTIDPASPRAAARARLRALADDHGRLAALRAVGDEIATWAASVAHWFPAGIAGGAEARSEISPRLAALPPVLDAAYATVMEDLLTEEETDLLCAAWDEVVPDPDEDEADEGEMEPSDVIEPDAAEAESADAGEPPSEVPGEPTDGRR
jgi:hypothetical protein